MRKVLTNKLLLIIVAILLLANIAMVAFFVWFKPGRRAFGGVWESPISVFLRKDIGFSAQQMGDFEKLRQQNRKKMGGMFEDIRLNKIQLYQQLSNPDVKDSTIERLASTIGEKQKLLDLQTFQNFREIRTLCTPEQKPKYDSLISGVVGKMWFAPRRDPGHRPDSLKLNRRLN